MSDPHNKNPTAMWVGAAMSVALLCIFWFLKYAQSAILDLQPQWLLVAIVPLAVGLIVGGYIRELKAGDYGVDFAAEEILEKSKPIADSHPSAAGKTFQSQPVAGWLQERAKEYARTHGYMLAHIYRPSKEPSQKFDISIFVVQHVKGTTSPPRDNLSEVERAEFFFGESWGNRVFEVDTDNGFFGVRTHAWGTFLASCRLTFKDSSRDSLILFRYIDFSMAADDE